MNRYILALLSLALCGFVSPNESHAVDFRVVIVDAHIIPTKRDRTCWDVCMAWDHGGLFRLTRKLQGRKGPKAWQQVINTVGAIHLLRGAKMPDAFAKLRFSNGQIIKTKTAANTLTPRWGTSGRVSLRKGDSLNIEVLDKDLRNHDRIGYFPTKRIPQRIIQKGGTWIVRFEQVYALKLKFIKVSSPSGGLFVPGLYEVTVLNAAIHKQRNDGKPWDLFKGKPDPFVKLTFGTFTLTTPVESNTLSPTWNYTRRVYLNGNERFVMAINDKDLGTQDKIGICRYNSVAQIPLDAKGRYRSQCRLAKEITIQLKKIR